MILSLVEKANLILPEGYNEDFSNPFISINIGEGNCIAASLILYTLREGPMDIIRYTTALDGEVSFNHFLCTDTQLPMGSIAHMVSWVYANPMEEYLRHYCFSENTARAVLAACGVSFPYLGRNNTVTEVGQQEGGYTVTERFAWIDPEALLDHVAPGQTMDALAKAANAALADKLSAAVV